MLSIKRLAVEHRTAPLGLDETQPCFGWVLDSDGQDVRQTAYALAVETDGCTVWDTGRVDSGESVSVRYEGAPLTSQTMYQARLTVWDNRGETARAETAFETGLLEARDFAAQWITHDFPEGETACPVFFKEFSARRPLRARLYASACGIYDAAVNGVPVSEDFFAPGWTDYKRRIQYQTYDVTPLIREENRIELTVAPGWYAGELNGASGHYGERTAVWAQLHLWYGDGREEIVATGTDWQVTRGPVRFAEFYHGETVDETAVPAAPAPARLFDAMPLERFTAQQCPPVRIGQKLAPIALFHTPAGETVLDFGQNLAGMVEITLEAQPGQTVTLRHGEVLDGDGNLYTKNLRAARATDTFICKGGPTVLRPRFTYHGFRYVSVEGMGGAPELNAFRACALILAFDLARPGHVPRIARTLADNLSRHGGKPATGFVGTAYLCHALTRAGRHDLAGALLLNGEYPGWLNQVKLGATTIWERWDSLRRDGSMDESGMNSFNHCAFGSIGSWMVEELAGIQPAAPGYREILFTPRLTQGLTWVRASRETPYGTASCAWRCQGGTITVDVTVPANASARLVLPEREGEGAICLGSGSYHYEYPTGTRLEPLKYTMDSTVAQLRADPEALALLEQAAPGNAAALGMEFLQEKTLRELTAMVPPELGQVYEDILRRLNGKNE